MALTQVALDHQAAQDGLASLKYEQDGSEMRTLISGMPVQELSQTISRHERPGAPV
jgi:hypothetical protein